MHFIDDPEMLEQEGVKFCCLTRQNFVNLCLSVNKFNFDLFRDKNRVIWLRRFGVPVLTDDFKTLPLEATCC